MRQDILSSQTTGRDTIEAHILMAADWVTSCSVSALNQARLLVPEITSISSVIYNGAEVPKLIPEPLPNNPPQLLCLGRLVPYKGFDLAINAFNIIIKKFPHARMIIAGDGPERCNLEKQVSILGLTKLVEFVGWVAPNKVPALINAATAVVMPSRLEGLPGVAIQAGLMARPVVATSVGGLPEIVIHQQTGLIIEKDDINKLVESITYLLEYPEKAVQMGQAARIIVQETFNWEQHVNAHDNIYRKFVNGTARKIYARSTT